MSSAIRGRRTLPTVTQTKNSQSIWLNRSPVALGSGQNPRNKPLSDSEGEGALAGGCDTPESSLLMGLGLMARQAQLTSKWAARGGHAA